MARGLGEDLQELLGNVPFAFLDAVVHQLPEAREAVAVWHQQTVLLCLMEGFVIDTQVLVEEPVELLGNGILLLLEKELALVLNRIIGYVFRQCSEGTLCQQSIAKGNNLAALGIAANMLFVEQILPSLLIGEAYTFLNVFAILIVFACQGIEISSPFSIAFLEGNEGDRNKFPIQYSVPRRE